ncbi:unnamed protein product [Amoebophrya sp. A120]|nr:unnamed protein product [Amoebophrya sp. A120]|eukprot:GSA120T00019848001.1
MSTLSRTKPISMSRRPAVLATIAAAALETGLLVTETQAFKIQRQHARPPLTSRNRQNLPNTKIDKEEADEFLLQNFNSTKPDLPVVRSAEDDERTDGSANAIDLPTHDKSLSIHDGYRSTTQNSMAQKLQANAGALQHTGGNGQMVVADAFNHATELAHFVPFARTQATHEVLNFVERSWHSSWSNVMTQFADFAAINYMYKNQGMGSVMLGFRNDIAHFISQPIFQAFACQLKHAASPFGSAKQDQSAENLLKSMIVARDKFFEIGKYGMYQDAYGNKAKPAVKVDEFLGKIVDILRPKGTPPPWEASLEVVSQKFGTLFLNGDIGIAGLKNAVNSKGPQAHMAKQGKKSAADEEDVVLGSSSSSFQQHLETAVQHMTSFMEVLYDSAVAVMEHELLKLPEPTPPDRQHPWGLSSHSKFLAPRKKKEVVVDAVEDPKKVEDTSGAGVDSADVNTESTGNATTFLQQSASSDLLADMNLKSNKAMIDAFHQHRTVPQEPGTEGPKVGDTLTMDEFIGSRGWTSLYRLPPGLAQLGVAHESVFCHWIQEKSGFEVNPCSLSGSNLAQELKKHHPGSGSKNAKAGVDDDLKSAWHLNPFGQTKEFLSLLNTFLQHAHSVWHLIASENKQDFIPPETVKKQDFDRFQEFMEVILPLPLLHSAAVLSSEVNGGERNEWIHIFHPGMPTAKKFKILAKLNEQAHEKYEAVEGGPWSIPKSQTHAWMLPCRDMRLSVTNLLPAGGSVGGRSGTTSSSSSFVQQGIKKKKAGANGAKIHSCKPDYVQHARRNIAKDVGKVTECQSASAKAKKPLCMRSFYTVRAAPTSGTTTETSKANRCGKRHMIRTVQDCHKALKSLGFRFKGKEKGPRKQVRQVKNRLDMPYGCTYNVRAMRATLNHVSENDQSAEILESLQEETELDKTGSNSRRKKFKNFISFCKIPHEQIPNAFDEVLEKTSLREAGGSFLQKMQVENRGRSMLNRNTEERDQHRQEGESVDDGPGGEGSTPIAPAPVDAAHRAETANKDAGLPARADESATPMASSVTASSTAAAGPSGGASAAGNGETGSTRAPGSPAEDATAFLEGKKNATTTSGSAAAGAPTSSPSSPTTAGSSTGPSAELLPSSDQDQDSQQTRQRLLKKAEEHDEKPSQLETTQHKTTKVQLDPLVDGVDNVPIFPLKQQSWKWLEKQTLKEMAKANNGIDLGAALGKGLATDKMSEKWHSSCPATKAEDDSQQRNAICKSEAVRCAYCDCCLLGDSCEKCPNGFVQNITACPTTGSRCLSSTDDMSKWSGEVKEKLNRKFNEYNVYYRQQYEWPGSSLSSSGASTGAAAATSSSALETSTWSIFSDAIKNSQGKDNEGKWGEDRLYENLGKCREQCDMLPECIGFNFNAGIDVGEENAADEEEEGDSAEQPEAGLDSAAAAAASSSSSSSSSFLSEEQKEAMRHSSFLSEEQKQAQHHTTTQRKIQKTQKKQRQGQQLQTRKQRFFGFVASLAVRAGRALWRHRRKIAHVVKKGFTAVRRVFSSAAKQVVKHVDFLGIAKRLKERRERLAREIARKKRLAQYNLHEARLKARNKQKEAENKPQWMDAGELDEATAVSCAMIPRRAGAKLVPVPDEDLIAEGEGGEEGGANGAAGGSSPGDNNSAGDAQQGETPPGPPVYSISLAFEKFQDETELEEKAGLLLSQQFGAGTISSADGEEDVAVPNSEKYLALRGDGSLIQEHLRTPVEVCLPVDRKLAVVCCDADEGIDGKSSSSSSPDFLTNADKCQKVRYTKSFHEAQQICAENSMQLCTHEQVKSGEAKSQLQSSKHPCNLDKFRVWTSTPCTLPERKVWTVAGNPLVKDYRNEVKNEPRALSDKLPFRCCDREHKRFEQGNHHRPENKQGDMMKYGNKSTPDENKCDLFTTETTFAKAAAICDHFEKRLCTKQEVEEGVVGGTGCDLDDARIWTATAVDLPHSKYVVLPGNPAYINQKSHSISKQNLSPQCHEPEELEASVRCCRKTTDPNWPAKVNMFAYDGRGATTFSGADICTDIKGKSFSEAEERCEGTTTDDKNEDVDMGLQVCSALSLAQGESTGTGCAFDVYQIWTTTACDSIPVGRTPRTRKLGPSTWRFPLPPPFKKLYNPNVGTLNAVAGAAKNVFSGAKKFVKKHGFVGTAKKVLGGLFGLSASSSSALQIKATQEKHEKPKVDDYGCPPGTNSVTPWRKTDSDHDRSWGIPTEFLDSAKKGAIANSGWCGLEGCSARYQYATIDLCHEACERNALCNSFLFEPIPAWVEQGGIASNHYQDRVCTLFPMKIPPRGLLRKGLHLLEDDLNKQEHTLSGNLICSVEPYSRVGCFVDNGKRVYKPRKGSGHPEVCRKHCLEQNPNMVYFGVQFGGECWCGEDKMPHEIDPKAYKQVPITQCNKKCSWVHTRGRSPLSYYACGGAWRNTVYKVRDVCPLIGGIIPGVNKDVCGAKNLGQVCSSKTPGRLSPLPDCNKHTGKCEAEMKAGDAPHKLDYTHTERYSSTMTDVCGAWYKMYFDRKKSLLPVALQHSGHGSSSKLQLPEVFTALAPFREHSFENVQWDALETDVVTHLGGENKKEDTKIMIDRPELCANLCAKKQTCPGFVWARPNHCGLAKPDAQLETKLPYEIPGMELVTTTTSSSTPRPTGSFAVLETAKCKNNLGCVLQGLTDGDDSACCPGDETDKECCFADSVFVYEKRVRDSRDCRVEDKDRIPSPLSVFFHDPASCNLAGFCYSPRAHLEITQWCYYPKSKYYSPYGGEETTTTTTLAPTLKNDFRRASYPMLALSVIADMLMFPKEDTIFLGDDVDQDAKKMVSGGAALKPTAVSQQDEAKRYQEAGLLLTLMMYGRGALNVPSFLWQPTAVARSAWMARFVTFPNDLAYWNFYRFASGVTFLPLKKRRDNYSVLETCNLKIDEVLALPPVEKEQKEDKNNFGNTGALFGEGNKPETTTPTTPQQDLSDFSLLEDDFIAEQFAIPMVALFTIEPLAVGRVRSFAKLEKELDLPEGTVQEKCGVAPVTDKDHLRATTTPQSEGGGGEGTSPAPPLQMSISASAFPGSQSIADLCDQALVDDQHAYEAAEAAELEEEKKKLEEAEQAAAAEEQTTQPPPAAEQTTAITEAPAADASATAASTASSFMEEKKKKSDSATTSLSDQELAAVTEGSAPTTDPNAVAARKLAGSKIKYGKDDESTSWCCGGDEEDAKTTNSTMTDRQARSRKESKRRRRNRNNRRPKCSTMHVRIREDDHDPADEDSEETIVEEPVQARYRGSIGLDSSSSSSAGFQGCCAGDQGESKNHRKAAEEEKAAAEGSTAGGTSTGAATSPTQGVPASASSSSFSERKVEGENEADGPRLPILDDEPQASAPNSASSTPLPVTTSSPAVSASTTAGPPLSEVPMASTTGTGGTTVASFVEKEDGKEQHSNSGETGEANGNSDSQKPAPAENTVEGRANGNASSSSDAKLTKEDSSPAPAETSTSPPVVSEGSATATTSAASFVEKKDEDKNKIDESPATSETPNGEKTTARMSTTSAAPPVMTPSATPTSTVAPTSTPPSFLEDAEKGPAPGAASANEKSQQDSSSATTSSPPQTTPAPSTDSEKAKNTSTTDTATTTSVAAGMSATGPGASKDDDASFVQKKSEDELAAASEAESKSVKEELEEEEEEEDQDDFDTSVCDKALYDNLVKGDAGDKEVLALPPDKPFDTCMNLLGRADGNTCTVVFNFMVEACGGEELLKENFNCIVIVDGSDLDWKYFAGIAETIKEVEKDQEGGDVENGDGDETEQGAASMLEKEKKKVEQHQQKQQEMKKLSLSTSHVTRDQRQHQTEQAYAKLIYAYLQCNEVSAGQGLRLPLFANQVDDWKEHTNGWPSDETVKAGGLLANKFDLNNYGAVRRQLFAIQKVVANLPPNARNELIKRVVNQDSEDNNDWRPVYKMLQEQADDLVAVQGKNGGASSGPLSTISYNSRLLSEDTMILQSLFPNAISLFLWWGTDELAMTGASSPDVGTNQAENDDGSLLGGLGPKDVVDTSAGKNEDEKKNAGLSNKEIVGLRKTYEAALSFSKIKAVASRDAVIRPGDYVTICPASAQGESKEVVDQSGRDFATKVYSGVLLQFNSTKGDNRSLGQWLVHAQPIKEPADSDVQHIYSPEDLLDTAYEHMKDCMSVDEVGEDFSDILLSSIATSDELVQFEDDEEEEEGSSTVPQEQSDVRQKKYQEKRAKINAEKQAKAAARELENKKRRVDDVFSKLSLSIPFMRCILQPKTYRESHMFKTAAAWQAQYGGRGIRNPFLEEQDPAQLALEQKKMKAAMYPGQEEAEKAEGAAILMGAPTAESASQDDESQLTAEDVAAALQEDDEVGADEGNMLAKQSIVDDAKMIEQFDTETPYTVKVDLDVYAETETFWVNAENLVFHGEVSSCFASVETEVWTTKEHGSVEGMDGHFKPENVEQMAANGGDFAGELELAGQDAFRLPSGGARHAQQTYETQDDDAPPVRGRGRQAGAEDESDGEEFDIGR